VDYDYKLMLTKQRYLATCIVGDGGEAWTTSPVDG